MQNVSLVCLITKRDAFGIRWGGLHGLVVPRCGEIVSLKTQWGLVHTIDDLGQLVPLAIAASPKSWVSTLPYTRKKSWVWGWVEVGVSPHCSQCGFGCVRCMCLLAHSSRSPMGYVPFKNHGLCALGCVSLCGWRFNLVQSDGLEVSMQGAGVEYSLSFHCTCL